MFCDNKKRGVSLVFLKNLSHSKSKSQIVIFFPTFAAKISNHGNARW